MSFDTDKRNTIERKRFKDVWFVEELDSGKSMWTRVGHAFENTDGSYTITLRAVPLGKGKLNMRDRDEAQRQVEAMHVQAVARAKRAEDDASETRRALADALAWIEDYKADHRAVVEGKCAGDERHCSCVPHLRRALDEAQRQVEAMRDRVRDVVNMCAFDCTEESNCGTCGAIFRALAVPSTEVEG